MGDDRSETAGLPELDALLDSGASVLDAIMSSTPSSALIVRAPDGKVMRVSDFACELFQRSREDFESGTYRELLGAVQLLDPDKRPVDPDAMPLIRALRGETVTGQEGWVPDASGELIPIVGGAAPIRNRHGEIIGAISELVDARQFKMLEAELRAAAEHQATLYRELTHRVKNHLHLVAGLVALETRDPAVTAKVLGDRIKGRLQTLAAVYNSMTRAETAGHVEARAFIENVLRPYESAQVSVSVTVAPPDLTLSSDQAGPIGMLLNEAVCNSCKHAFPDRDGRITVELRRDTPGRLTLEIADDGVGRRERPPSERVSHGLNLMQLHARQLNGEFAIGDRPGGGTTVCLDMPEA